MALKTSEKEDGHYKATKSIDCLVRGSWERVLYAGGTCFGWQ